MENSVYIIKPDGMAFRDQIRAKISASGLVLALNRVLKIPAWALAKIYPDLAQADDGLWQATLSHMAEGESEIGIVSGTDAVCRLFHLCGHATKPQDCAEGTIRRLYGSQTPVQVEGGKLYWKNIIHRSKDHAEAGSDLVVYVSLIAPESH